MSLVRGVGRVGSTVRGCGGEGGESITELREDVTSPCLGGSRLSSPKTTNEIRPFFPSLKLLLRFEKSIQVRNNYTTRLRSSNCFLTTVCVNHPLYLIVLFITGDS